MSSLLSDIQITDSDLQNDVETLKKQYAEIFNEPNQNGMALPRMGGLMNSNISLPVAAVGVLASGAVRSMAVKYFPQLDKWAGIAVGAVFILFGKRKKLIKDFGVGVLLGGIAYAFEDLSASLTSRFAERKSFDEDRITWGGVDGGTTVMSPERRTIQ